MDQACRLAGRAVAAAPDNSTCLASAAFTYGVLSRRFDEAFDLANRAVVLHPNSVLVRHRAGAVYVVCGEFDKPIAQCEAASRMNPLASKKAATGTYSLLSCALYFAGRFEECVDAGWRALALARRTLSAASTSPCPSPSLAALVRRRPRSQSFSSTRPTLRLRSSGSKVSATNG